MILTLFICGFFLQCNFYFYISPWMFLYSLSGISRSSAVVLAYLMKTKGMSLDEALVFLQNRYPKAKWEFFWLSVLGIILQDELEPWPDTQSGSWKSWQEKTVFEVTSVNGWICNNNNYYCSQIFEHKNLVSTSWLESNYCTRKFMKLMF